jgi:hypothetical protein
MELGETVERAITVEATVVEEGGEHGDLRTEKILTY